MYLQIKAMKLIKRRKKKMKNHKKFVTTAIILVLTLLPILSIINSGTKIAVAQNLSSVPNNMLQYEWPSPLGDTSLGWFTAGGPGPTVGDYLWKSDLGQPVAAFNGLLFLSGGHAVDPYTGELIYTCEPSWGTPRYFDISTSTTPTKLNATHFWAGDSLYETATGQTVATVDMDIPPIYDPEVEKFWVGVQGGGVFNVDALIEVYDFPSDFSQNPTLAYTLVNSNGWRSIDSHYGKIFCGTVYGSVMCFDMETGELIWETPINGYLGYHGAFWDGIWVAAGQDDEIMAFNTENGELLWEFRPTGTGEDFFSFWEDAGCISNGVLY